MSGVKKHYVLSDSLNNQLLYLCKKKSAFKKNVIKAIE